VTQQAWYFRALQQIACEICGLVNHGKEKPLERNGSGMFKKIPFDAYLPIL